MKTEESGLFQDLKHDLKIRIEEAEKEATDQYDLVEKNDENETREKLFIARSKVVKGFDKDLDKAHDWIIKNYGAEYWRGGKWYPRVWMLRDKRIAATIERYPIVEILNFIDKESRFKKGQSYKDMVEIADRVTGGKKYMAPKGPCDFASFLVETDDFYRRIRKKVGYSQVYIQKFMQSFCECGILIKLGKVDRHGGMLYADGYYTQWGDKLVKHLFLTSEKHKQALRTFRPKGISVIYSIYH